MARPRTAAGFILTSLAMRLAARLEAEAASLVMMTSMRVEQAPPMRVKSLSYRVDEVARYFGILVQIITRTNAVISVGNNQGAVTLDVTPHEQNR